MLDGRGKLEISPLTHTYTHVQNLTYFFLFATKVYLRACVSTLSYMHNLTRNFLATKVTK